LLKLVIILKRDLVLASAISVQGLISSISLFSNVSKISVKLTSAHFALGKFDVSQLICARLHCISSFDCRIGISIANTDKPV
jgi:hypothetical protein